MPFPSLGRHARVMGQEPEETEGRYRRRRSVSAATIALLTLAAVSALGASAAAPSNTAAQSAPRPRPNYLQPVGTLVRHGYLPFPALLGDVGTAGVPNGTRPAPTQPDPAVAAHQAPAIAQFQGADGTLTAAGIATLALEHGCAASTAATGTAIAMAESGGSPSAQGDIGLMTDVWDWSAGLWQIRGLRAERGTGGLRDAIANQDADTNAASMYVVSSGCTDWTPWSTYNSGAYEVFLPLAEQAVRYVITYYTAHGHHYPPVGAPDPTSAIPVQGSGGPTAASGSGVPPTRHPTRHPRSSPTSARSSSAQKAVPTTRATSSARPAPAPTSTAQPAPSRLHISLPPLPTTSIPIPIPSLTLPIPSPSLTVPTLPGLP